jgi:hypothetical protein
MKQAVVVAALLLAGLVHLLPASGVLGGERLVQLYGPAAADPALQLLLRHRALLFGLLALLCLAAIGQPTWRMSALCLATGSVAGYLLLAGPPAELVPALRRVFWVDAALLPLLLAALMLQRPSITR